MSYENITLEFAVSSTGALTVMPGYPVIVPATQPLATAFEAGKYVGPSDIFSWEMIINVSGPSVTAGGATEWSLASGSGAYIYTYPNSATWYDGPIASSPYAALLKAAGITSTAWSYGIGSSNWYSPWLNALLGFSQVGNTITIVGFTDSSGDHSLPIGQITYTYSPN